MNCLWNYFVWHSASKTTLVLPYCHVLKMYWFVSADVVNQLIDHGLLKSSILEIPLCIV